jgi:TRAP-type mannitol/chloroaromatic compound transport system permease large subunit
MDPIWFSILILIQLELAGITPPFGVLLFVMKGVRPQLSIIDIYRAAFPIVLLQFLVIALVIAFPGLTSWLPSLMVRN